ncbi:unnamed protein product [Lactuca virosa]|uniref:DC1 domain-containing protein n=1 Tax=Lactuca virosa TaxID=75947 RepID=A0AAU9PV53_9ASTR|nr:unnamed protein product [Lactuca virosa]
MEEINHFSHENHQLKLLDYETIVGASVNGGDEKSGLIGCYACEKPISSGVAYASNVVTFFIKNVHNFRSKSGVFSYTFEKDKIYIFKACIDCCVGRIARKAEADAIKEEAKMKRNEWLYHCANCRYFVHIRCALNAEQTSTTQRDVSSTSFVDKDLKDLLEFPMSEAFTDPLKLLHLDKTIIDDDDTKEIKHWSHHHPLILNVIHQVNNMYGMISSDPIEVCHGCVRPLSLPFYSCKDGCSFTLHKYCTELPLKLQHPLHPDHSLVLINTTGHGINYTCIGCFSYANMFFYNCETCKFYLDVNCAFLPKTIKHKSHKHPLIQVIDPGPLCNACNMWSNCIRYVCKACSFILGMKCAMRSPHTLGHRYCKGHEIPLTYPPVMDHLEDFYCDICEEEMHPKFPLYYCGNCKNSFHLDCISRFDYYSNIFKEGTLNVSYHKHPLTFVRRKKTPKYVCSVCNQDINGYQGRS